MKELEKVKNISIVTTLFILMILIGLLTFDRPKNLYTENTESTLNHLITSDYYITKADLKKYAITLIDVRPQFEYDKGHLEHAINITTPEILNKNTTSVLESSEKLNKTIVIYGKTPEQANIFYLILYQLGYKNLKILPIETHYDQNKLITDIVDIEKPENDIKAFIEASSKYQPSNKSVTTQAPPKRVITIKKKKKQVAEGGC